MSKKPQSKTYALNKKARRDYEIIETYEAGIELRGTEVKAIKSGGNVQFADAHIRCRDGQVFLLNCHIARYEFGTHSNHEETRTRRLLMHKNQILKISQQMKEKGLTMVPLKMYPSRHLIKVEVGLARGKKVYEKREDLKKKDVKMNLSRQFASGKIKV
jgi:SsrA-binding protein